MLHDPGNEDRVLIGEGVHIDLNRALQIAVDKNWVIAGDDHRILHVTAQAGNIVDNLHGPAAQNIGGADNQRITNVDGGCFGFLKRADNGVCRLLQVQFLQQLLEPLTVLGEVDGVR